MDLEEAIGRLKTAGDPKSVAHMARVGILPDKAFGTRVPYIRALAREIGKDTNLARDLWAAGYRETMILAPMIDDPKALTGDRMETLAAGFYDWEVCDQCCLNLFEKNPLAWTKAVEWSSRTEEFVKRAGFVLMARLAVSDKKAPDDRFAPFLPIIVRESTDGRNGVKKAVNWALRQIGKRSLALNARAVAAAREIAAIDSKAARWVASDAFRELTGEAVIGRLREREKKGK